MDPMQNPFSPGAGSPPPELVGRDQILKQSRILCGRIRNRRSEKSLLLTGLRGVGKTVLLNEMERIAEEEGYKTIFIEAREEKTLGALLALPLRKLLFNLGHFSKAGEKVRRALAVLRSFISGVKFKIGDIEFGLDIEAERGSADSGDIESDLPDLFLAVAEAAQEKQTAVAILIDEIQYFSINEISALIMAMHKMQQRQLPLILLAAGLPILPALAGESKSYAERLFQFPSVGPLSESDAEMALNDPIKEKGMKFSVEALHEIFRLTQGYPYFLQEWGYQCWNHTIDPIITLNVVKDTTPEVIARLDENFFRVRFDRLTPSEKNYLRAMAKLGPSPHRSGEIADILGVKISSLGPVRAKLIKKGMIYSPIHGDMAFTVPLFDEFMRRAMVDF
ncbi:MAG: AAA family ATPase [Gammaproteobacteria bacterium RIFCSPHIGHO2_12_FULL_45_9]|nr:MAG: AAA family ATPase [Gammaproteobacteria bacterium RIFCSPHIGHO2_12_FULL_45_9]